MSVLISGGTVVDQSGERRADVVIDDGCIVAVDAEVDGDRLGDQPRRHGLCRGSRFRRPACAPSRARRRGRRNDRERQPGGGARWLHGRRGDAQYRPPGRLARRRRAGWRPGSRRRTVRRLSQRVHHGGTPRRTVGTVRRVGRGGRAPVHRRWERRPGPAVDASGHGVHPWTRRGARPALRGERPDERAP